MAKRAYNPKSRENLRQFQEAKNKKDLNHLTKEILEEIEVDEDLLDVIVAVKEVCIGKEQDRFIKYVKEYLKEYSKKGTELTISDIDDIATLCMNNIMITRMYKEAKGNTDVKIADVMAAVDRLKKDNVKLKENLASTRKDRVDPKAGQIITVSDILDDYMKGRREGLKEKQEKYAEEEREFRDKIKSSVEDLIT